MCTNPGVTQNNARPGNFWTSALTDLEKLILCLLLMQRMSFLGFCVPEKANNCVILGATDFYVPVLQVLQRIPIERNHVVHLSNHVSLIDWP